MNVKLLLLCTLPLILLESCNAIHDDVIEQVHTHHHVDPSTVVFFFLEDLHLGNTMPVYFPQRQLDDALPHLLSRDEADSIPFSSRHLQLILHRFSFSPDSPQAQAIKNTLQECERDPITGETKYCATSWESLSEFLHTIFGPDTPFDSLATTHTKILGSGLQNYTIVGIREIPAPKMVSCHTMPYAYTVFFCHYQESENRVYRVSLEGENRDDVEAIAVCHMDTSEWTPNHVAFKMLGTHPGSSNVCHFFPADNFVCVPSNAI